MLDWIAYIFIVSAALILLVVILFFYYKGQNKKLFSKLIPKSDALPRLVGGNPALDKMDEMLQEIDLSEGLILFDVPMVMYTGKNYKIVSKIAHSKKLLIKENESTVIHEILITDLMSCKLSGEAFKISFINNEIQKIFKNDITQWQWDVIPRQGGVQSLLLVASIHVKTGNDTHLKDIPVFERPVVVEINAPYHVKQFFVKNWQWLISTIIGSGILWEVLKLKFNKG
jgi:hypothetical protein